MRPSPPWRLDVADLLGDVGSQRQVQIVEPIESVCVGSTCSRADEPLRLDMVLEESAGGLGLSGTLSVAWTGQCRRCLEPVEGETVAEIDESFVVEHEEGESYEIRNDVIDLLPAARDLVALSLPMVPLCGEDCVGPQPQRFPVAVDDDVPKERPPDPRWAALDALRSDDDELASGDDAE